MRKPECDAHSLVVPQKRETPKGGFLREFAFGTMRVVMSVVRPVKNLSPKESLVLACKGRGLSDKEIAGHLDISIHTAKKHVKRILEKTGARSAAEAVHLMSRSAQIASAESAFVVSIIFVPPAVKKAA